MHKTPRISMCTTHAATWYPHPPFSHNSAASSSSSSEYLLFFPSFYFHFSASAPWGFGNDGLLDIRVGFARNASSSISYTSAQNPPQLHPPARRERVRLPGASEPERRVVRPPRLVVGTHVVRYIRQIHDVRSHTEPRRGYRGRRPTCQQACSMLIEKTSLGSFLSKASTPDIKGRKRLGLCVLHGMTCEVVLCGPYIVIVMCVVVNQSFQHYIVIRIAPLIHFRTPNSLLRNEIDHITSEETTRVHRMQRNIRQKSPFERPPLSDSTHSARTATNHTPKKPTLSDMPRFTPEKGHLSVHCARKPS